MANPLAVQFICTRNNYFKSIRNLADIPAQVHSHRTQFVHGRVTFGLNDDYSDLLGAYRPLAYVPKVHIVWQKSDPRRRSERPGPHVSSGTGVSGRTRIDRPGAAENTSAEEVFNRLPSCSFCFSIVNDLLCFLRGPSLYPSPIAILLLVGRLRIEPVLVNAFTGYLPSPRALVSVDAMCSC